MPNWLKDRRKVTILCIILAAFIISSIGSIVAVNTAIKSVSRVLQVGRGYELDDAIRVVINRQAIDGVGSISRIANILQNGFISPRLHLENLINSVRYEIYESVVDILSIIR